MCFHHSLRRPDVSELPDVVMRCTDGQPSGLRRRISTVRDRNMLCPSGLHPLILHRGCTRLTGSLTDQLASEVAVVRDHVSRNSVVRLGFARHTLHAKNLGITLRLITTPEMSRRFVLVSCISGA